MPLKFLRDVTDQEMDALNKAGREFLDKINAEFFRGVEDDDCYDAVEYRMKNDCENVDIADDWEEIKLKILGVEQEHWFDERVLVVYDQIYVPMEKIKFYLPEEIDEDEYCWGYVDS